MTSLMSSPRKSAKRGRRGEPITRGRRSIPGRTFLGQPRQFNLHGRILADFDLLRDELEFGMPQIELVAARGDVHVRGSGVIGGGAIGTDAELNIRDRR